MHLFSLLLRHVITAVRVRAEGQEKALRKQKIQGQRASQGNVARTATPTSDF